MKTEIIGKPRPAIQTRWTRASGPRAVWKRDRRWYSPARHHQMKPDYDGKKRTMTLNGIKPETFARNATRILAALLAVFFVGGGLSHATPQRGDKIYCAS